MLLASLLGVPGTPSAQEPISPEQIVRRLSQDSIEARAEAEAAISGLGFPVLKTLERVAAGSCPPEVLDGVRRIRKAVVERERLRRLVPPLHPVKAERHTTTVSDAVRRFLVPMGFTALTIDAPHGDKTIRIDVGTDNVWQVLDAICSSAELVLHDPAEGPRLAPGSSRVDILSGDLGPYRLFLHPLPPREGLDERRYLVRLRPPPGRCIAYAKVSELVLLDSDGRVLRHQQVSENQGHRIPGQPGQYDVAILALEKESAGRISLAKGAILIHSPVGARLLEVDLERPAEERLLLTSGRSECELVMFEGDEKGCSYNLRVRSTGVTFLSWIESADFEWLADGPPSRGDVNSGVYVEGRDGRRPRWLVLAALEDERQEYPFECRPVRHYRW